MFDNRPIAALLQRLQGVSTGARRLMRSAFIICISLTRLPFRGSCQRRKPLTEEDCFNNLRISL